MNRREFLALTAATGLSLSPAGSSAAVRTRVRLVAETQTVRLAGDKAGPTTLWRYTGVGANALIRVPQGEEMQVSLRNRLKQPTTIHWHGLRLANAMDGVPGLTQKAVAPGARFEYRFTPPDAGTYWFHTHEKTWEQLARGLYGVLIVDEKRPPKVDQDIVWVLDDWRLDKEGAIDEASLGALHDWAHRGRLGNWLTVNGEPEPIVAVQKGERVRLRLINAANARIMTLRFKHAATVIALDGQPTAPHALQDNQLALSPGQRADLMIDMMEDPGAIAPVEIMVKGRGYAVARFVYDKRSVQRDRPRSSAIVLPPNPLAKMVPKLAGVRPVPLLMTGGAMSGMSSARYQGKTLSMRELMRKRQIWALNGEAGLPKQPLLRVRRGKTVVIDIHNDNRWPHAMHLHGYHFRLVDDQGRLSGPWRDTHLMYGDERARIAFVADNPGKWLLHCHMVEHTAGGMLTWIEVI